VGYGASSPSHFDASSSGGVHREHDNNGLPDAVEESHSLPVLGTSPGPDQRPGSDPVSVPRLGEPRQWTEDSPELARSAGFVGSSPECWYALIAVPGRPPCAHAGRGHDPSGQPPVRHAGLDGVWQWLPSAKAHVTVDYAAPRGPTLRDGLGRSRPPTGAADWTRWWSTSGTRRFLAPKGGPAIRSAATLPRWSDGASDVVSFDSPRRRPVMTRSNASRRDPRGNSRRRKKDPHAQRCRRTSPASTDGTNSSVDLTQLCIDRKESWLAQSGELVTVASDLDSVGPRGHRTIDYWDTSYGAGHRAVYARCPAGFRTDGPRFA